MPHALLVDDDANFVLGLAEVVGREGFTTKAAHTLKEARAELAKGVPDVVLVDLHLPDGSGLDLFKDLEGAAAEVVLITAQASVDTAVESMRKGASDYLVKPVDLARVRGVLANVTRTRELKEQIGSLRGELRKLGRFGPLIGASPAMQRVYDMVAKVAPTEATVLLQGETGTGKELVAETIHGLSRRHKEAFLPVNCGAVSPHADRERAVRPRAGQLHRRGPAPQGLLRARPQGDAVPGRGHRDAHGAAGEAPAGAGDRQGHAGGRQRGDPDRRAGGGSHQPPARGGRRQGQAAGGPPLPPQRVSHHAAAPAGARRRRGAAGRVTSWPTSTRSTRPRRTSPAPRSIACAATTGRGTSAS